VVGFGNDVKTSGFTTIVLILNNMRCIIIYWVILTGCINMTSYYSNCTHFSAFTVNNSITTSSFTSHAKSHCCHFFNLKV
jgi:hypothetical protein